MARVEIELPETYHFASEISVRIGDINFAGHLAHDALLTLIHEARARLFHEFGYDELNVEGLGIIMADAAIVYRSEVRWGESLRFDLAVKDFSGKGCDVVYRITEASSGREVARAKTGIVFFDYEEGEAVAVPDGWRRKFEK